jgi:hypothetical protein
MPITPNDWGGCKWLSIHITCYYVDVAFGRNVDRQKQLHAWLKLSAPMLPCGVCERHFAKFMTDTPLPDVKAYEPGETPYLRWSIQAHNNVRARQHKPLADEEVVVLSYKSGKMYGADKYLAAPNARTSLSTTDVQETPNDADPSDASTSDLNSYKITTFILAGLLGAALIAALAFWIAHRPRKRRIPELSD